MIKNIALLSSLSLSLCAPSAMAEVGNPSTTFPAELRGNWYEADNYEAPICTADDLGLLQIDDKTFTFPLEVGSLIRITENKTYEYDVQFSEQAVTDGPRLPRPVKRKHLWTLSHDGEHLNIVAKGMTLDLFRCQEPATAAPSANPAE